MLASLATKKALHTLAGLSNGTNWAISIFVMLVDVKSFLEPSVAVAAPEGTTSTSINTSKLLWTKILSPGHPWFVVSMDDASSKIR
jgi:hypothetical protein